MTHSTIKSCKTDFTISICGHKHKNTIRACLDQLLIAIRSLTILCKQSRSETRLIAIINLTGELPKLCVKMRPDSWLVCGPFRCHRHSPIAKLGIIYATLYNHAGLSEHQLSLPPHRAYYYIQTRHRERGGVGSSESFAAAAAWPGSM